MTVISVLVSLLVAEPKHLERVFTTDLLVGHFLLVTDKVKADSITYNLFFTHKNL